MGESYEDKSFPHDFVSCSTEDFEHLPDLVKVKASELLKQEVERANRLIEELQKKNEELTLEYERIQNLKL